MGDYTTSFGAQWQAYRRTQLDSYTGTTYSRDRLERCLGAPLESLKDHTVLEAGSGAGRFTEWLVRYGKMLVSCDASDAVVANLDNCRHLGRYLLVQADINALPLPRHAFDVVICLGVLQHTPAPETAIARLAEHLAPGGRLILDHYRFRSWAHHVAELLSVKTLLRAILRRVARRHPAVALQMTRRLTAICDPIRRRTCGRPLDRLASRLFPSQCYYAAYPELPPAIAYEWNALDTHDRLTDWYKHRRSVAQIRATLAGLGLIVERCEYAGNGVEARAHRPR